MRFTFHFYLILAIHVFKLTRNAKHILTKPKFLKWYVFINLILVFHPHAQVIR